MAVRHVPACYPLDLAVLHARLTGCGPWTALRRVRIHRRPMSRDEWAAARQRRAAA